MRYQIILPMLGLSTVTLISSTTALAQVAASNDAIIVTAPRQERTARSARTAALDPVTGRVYLSAVDYDPSDTEKRPKAVPGTFRVVVVEPVNRRPAKSCRL